MKPPRIAVFPGSFDPITYGHTDIIERAAKLFDEVYIAIGNNTSKNYLMPFEKRVHAVAKTFLKHENIKVTAYQELTVTFCKKLSAGFIIRGLRSSTDFDFEKAIAEMNSKLDPEIETVFLISRPEFSAISSTIVREIWRFGGDISAFVPGEALKEL